MMEGSSRPMAGRSWSWSHPAPDQIGQLRVTGVSLIYDPATKTLRADSNDTAAVRAV